MKKYKLGFTAGNFNLLHPGYIYTFEEAKKRIIILVGILNIFSYIPA